MLIYFCDHCGKLLSKTGHSLPAPLNDDSPSKRCSACAHLPRSAVIPVSNVDSGQHETADVPAVLTAQRRPTDAHVKPTHKTTMRRAVPHAHADAHGHTPAHVHASDDKPNYMLMGGVAAGVVGVGLIVFLFIGRGPARATPSANTVPPVKPTPTVAREANPPVSELKTFVSTNAAKDPQLPLKQEPPPVVVEPPRPPVDTGNIRDNRAARLLEEVKAWHTQNPADPWTYQSRLRELAGLYGSAPAAVEARKLLEDLKNLPPQPDRLELAAPESKEYQLVYDIDLANPKQYVADNRAQLKGGFDRIAYFLEMNDGSEVQYLYVSMDAFTDDAGKIGIPTTASGARFQQNVANMNVYSNVKEIVTGTGIAGGNIEFWPSNYGPRNAANVPNASNEKYDFGDDAAQGEGYGSMQVHNHDAKQTLFAYNKWNAGNGADLGIGNQPSGNSDWTFSGSAGRYKMKRLRVLVHVK